MALDKQESGPTTVVDHDSDLEEAVRWACKITSAGQRLLDHRWQRFVAGFEALKTKPRDRISYCVQQQDVMDFIHCYYEQSACLRASHGKDSAKAKQFREAGNELFRKRLFEGALESYSKAVCSAPTDDSELALAFANRSAVLFQLKKYQQALLDIDDALERNYPDELKTKLLVRRINCLLNLKKYEEAQLLGKEVLLKVDDKLRDELKRHLEKAKNEEKNLSTDEGSEQTSKLFQELKENVDSPNESIPSASKSVRIEFSPEKGRHVVADEEIAFQTLVMVERPFAAVIYKQHCHEFCHFCFANLNGRAVACRQCDQIRYCSHQCSEDAWRMFHQFECDSLLNLADELGLFYLVVRILARVGIRQALELFKQKTDETSENYLNDYRSVVGLLPHFEETDSNTNLLYCLSTVFILVMLTKINLINDLTEEEINDLGFVILTHIHQLATNSIHILEQRDVRLEPTSYNFCPVERPVGVAVYPTISLLNHSCVPNVWSVFDGSRLTILAAKTIRSGEEVNYCYGPSFASMTKRDRQAKLIAQYFFKCQCVVCSSGAINKRIAIRCRACNGPADCSNDGTSECANCHKTELIYVDKLQLQVAKAKQLLRLGKEQMRSESMEEAYVSLVKGLNALHSQLYRLNNEVFDANQRLCECLALMGHYDKAIELANKRVDHCTTHFGRQSFETLQELVKLLSLKCELIAQDDGLADEELTQQKRDAKSLHLNVLEMVEQLSHNNQKVKAALVPEIEYLAFKMRVVDD